MTIKEQLEDKITPEMQMKHFNQFERQARYFGNNVYGVPGTSLYSKDTRELLLMFVASRENIPFKKD